MTEKELAVMQATAGDLTIEERLRAFRELMKWPEWKERPRQTDLENELWESDEYPLLHICIGCDDQEMQQRHAAARAKLLEVYARRMKACQTEGERREERKAYDAALDDIDMLKLINEAQNAGINPWKKPDVPLKIGDQVIDLDEWFPEGTLFPKD